MKDANFKGKAIRSVVGCLIVQLCVGILYTWSVIKSSVASTLQLGDSSATLVASGMLMGFVVGCLIGGILVDKKGPRFTCVLGVCLFSLGIGTTGFLNVNTSALIFVTYAGMGGLGSGFAYSACISCIQKWMPTRRGLASGLAVGAFGLSTVIFAPVFKALMSAFTAADGSLRMLPFFATSCGIFLVAGLLSCLLIAAPPEQTAANGAKIETSRTLGEAVKTSAFWYILVSVFFINGAWNLASPLLRGLGEAKGLSADQAVLAVSVTGIASAAGRLIMATLSDKIGRRSSLIALSVLTIIASIAMIISAGYGYFVAVCLLAFAYGGPSSVNAAITTDCFGPKNSGSIYGVILLALGASSVFFNFISQSFLGGDVTATFIMAAVSAVVPIIMMVLLGRAAKKAA